MPRIATERVNASIRALTRAGVSGAEIHRRLMAGHESTGLPALDRAAIAERTVQEKAMRYREEYRRETDPLGRQSAPEALDAVMRDSLRITIGQLEQIKERHAKGLPLDGADARAIRDWSRTAAELRAHLKRAAEPPATVHHAASAKQKTKVHPEDALDRIAADLARARAASDLARDSDPGTNGASGADPLPSAHAQSPEGNDTGATPSGA